MESSFSFCPSMSFETGMPVHLETTSAISSGVTSSRSMAPAFCASASSFCILSISACTAGSLPNLISAALLKSALRSASACSVFAASRSARSVESFWMSPFSAVPAGLQAGERLVQAGDLLLHVAEAPARGVVLLLPEPLLLDLQLRDAPADLVHLGGHGVDLDAQPAGGLVDQVDGLVGQEAVGDVAVGEARRVHQGRVLDADLVVDLVALLQAAQDGDGVLHRRLAHEDRLEAPLQRRVLLDVLAVLVQRGGADGVQLAAGQRRLEHVAGVHGPLGRARAHDGVHLVDEEDDLPLGGDDLLQHGLEPLLELAAELGAGDQRAHVEREDLLVLQPLGHVAVDDAAGQPLDDGGLAHARVADQHRVVLGAPGEDLDDAPDLLVAADHRVELALAGQLGEVLRRTSRARGTGSPPRGS